MVAYLGFALRFTRWRRFQGTKKCFNLASVPVLLSLTSTARADVVAQGEIPEEVAEDESEGGQGQAEDE